MDQDKLRDILYRHAVAARDIGQGLANDFVSQLNAFDEELSDLIAARYARIERDGFDKGPATTKALEDMRTAYAKVNAEAYKKAAGGLTADLFEIAKHEATFAAKAVSSAGEKLDFGATIPGPQYLKALITTTPLPFADDGHTLLMPWLEVQEAGRLRRLEGSLRMSAGLGESTGQAVRRIMGTKAGGYTDGILQTSRKDATTIALTANNAISNAARNESYSRMKSIRYVEWSAILDGRTSQICQGRSGTIYVKGSQHPQPPAHPRCRSHLLPRRDNEGTKHKPYGDWLREQPDSVQDEVLGKARADIFRKNPDFDFAGYFKEGGGYKSLGELRQFDERLFAEGGVKSPGKAKAKPEAPKPAPEPERAPEPPQRLTSAVDPAINDNTVPVISRKDATKRLNAALGENAKAAAYDPRPEFKGIKAEHFGKAQLGAAFSDEAASAIVALWPEIDRITDAFKIPRLRAIRTISGSSAIANMGDGTLGAHATHLNAFASKIGVSETGAESAALKKLKAQHAELKAEIDKMNATLTEMRQRMVALGTSVENREARFVLATEQREFVAKFRIIAQREFKLRGQIRTMERQGGAEPVSTWKPGDDVKLRPYTNDKYFSGIDKMRSTLYHETAHHVHQMWKKEGRRGIVGSPPLERRLKQMFFNKFHGAAFPKNMGQATENKNKLSSTYATTNEYEWWAEGFAAYMMGRHDLADPDLVKLIEELLDEARDS
ncbi:MULTISPECIES: minor capsid protein [Sphingomonas]|uniref:minor capsid protein n=1 Tax=Sphingomonas TaxID=13687 RepID=UPI000F7F5372|nr:minor capsid protein [Sphingomonas sp. ABOLF]GLK19235.1 hypothetical protein GCM10017606_00610 [Microbacterium terregens]